MKYILSMTAQSLSEYIGVNKANISQLCWGEPGKGHYVALIAPIGPICNQNVICTLIGIHRKSSGRWPGLTELLLISLFFIPFMCAFEYLFSSHLQTSLARPRFCTIPFLISPLHIKRLKKIIIVDYEQKSGSLMHKTTWKVVSFL